MAASSSEPSHLTMRNMLLRPGPIARPQIRFELFLECFAAAMDERFGGGKRTVQDLGDLFGARLILPAEQDGGALVLRQFGQRLLDFFGELSVEHIVRRQENLLVLVLALGLVFMFAVRFFERLGGMARAAADFVQAQIARDGEKPGGKFRRAFVTGAGFVNLEKNILREILGLGLVAQRAV